MSVPAIFAILAAAGEAAHSGAELKAWVLVGAVSGLMVFISTLLTAVGFFAVRELKRSDQSYGQLKLSMDSLNAAISCLAIEIKQIEINAMKTFITRQEHERARADVKAELEKGIRRLEETLKGFIELHHGKGAK